MITNAENNVAPQVGVAGLGRVGLISLFHLAEKGFSPVGVDVSLDRIDKLSKGESPFLEPGFTELLNKYRKNITWTTDFRPARYWFVAVPTPFDKHKAKMDLSFVEKALRDISFVSKAMGDEKASQLGKGLSGKRFYSARRPIGQEKRPVEKSACVSAKENSDKGNLVGKTCVFIRSTLSVGSLRQLSHSFKTLNLAYMPEFLREGCFVRDLKATKFSVLACENPKYFRPHFEQFGFPPVETCQPEEGELLKLLSNMFHAMKVGFANEAGRLAQAFHVSPERIMELFTQEDRLNISKAYLKPGFSFSGPCLQKDIQSLGSAQQSRKTKPVLAQSVLQSNIVHTEWAAQRIMSLKPKTVSILGCSFTAHPTVDERSSGIVELAKILSRSGRNLKLLCVEKAFSPYVSTVFLEESFEKLMTADVFVIGGWSPLLKKYASLFENYFGIVFDLLVQRDLPSKIKNHPRYKNLYSPSGHSSGQQC